MKILEVGSGVVGHPHHVFLRDDNIVHFDIDRNAFHVEVLGDVHKLPFKTASVGAVNASHIFEHLENPLMTLKECHRVLRVGGLLVLRVPNGSFFKWKSSGKDHLFSWNQYTLKNFICQVFSDVDVKSFLRSVGGRRRRKFLNLLLCLFMGENELVAYCYKT